MINEVFASDETIALAKEKACKMLGASEDKVGFEVRQFPSKKVFGMFGGKLAQVRAFLKKTSVQTAADYLKEIFFYMGLESIKIDITKEDYDCCEIKITGDDVGFIVGKHGETLDSLQYLAGLVANSKIGAGETPCRLRLEAGDYREKRKKTLEALGRHIAERAIKTGKKLSLEPMRSYERKIIHTSIGAVEGARSWSEGEGERRHVVIAPKAKEWASEFGRATVEIAEE